MRIAIVRNGQVERQSGATGDVPWWSFTKTILAAATLHLVAQGRLSLDAPFRGRPYTVRQLLQHTAGLREYGVLPAYHEAVARGDRPWPVEELLARVQADKLRWQPGEGWAYSNIGYLFVRQLVEETFGGDLGSALKALVFDPLRIAGGRVANEPRDLADVDMGATRGYHPGWVYHGLVVGPVSDAALLLDRLLRGGLLPPDLMTAMQAAHPVEGSDPARPEQDWSYGLGLMMGRIASGERSIGHTGGGPGTAIAVRHLTTRGFTAAAFAAGDGEAPVEHAAVRGEA